MRRMTVVLRSISTLMVLHVALLLSACEQGPSLEQVQAVGNKVFDAIIKEDKEGALALYDEQFFATHSRDEWWQYLQRIHQKLGVMRAHNLRKDHYDTRYSGRFYIFEYQTVYERGNAWETLTFINPNGSSDIKLVAHQVKAKGL